MPRFLKMSMLEKKGLTLEVRPTGVNIEVKDGGINKECESYSVITTKKPARKKVVSPRKQITNTRRNSSKTNTSLNIF